MCLTARKIAVLRDSKKKLDIIDFLLNQGVTDVNTLRVDVELIEETQKINPSFDLTSFRVTGGVVEMG